MHIFAIHHFGQGSELHIYGQGNCEHEVAALQGMEGYFPNLRCICEYVHSVRHTLNMYECAAASLKFFSC